MNRFLIIGLSLPALLLPASSYASFDLLLITDNNATLGNHIDRYDPVSRLYLGSFQISPFAPTSIVTSTATGEVFIRATPTSVDVYNYSTGDYLRQISFTGGYLGISSDGKTLQTLSGNNYITASAVTGTILTTLALAGASNPKSFVNSPSGRLIVADDGHAQLRSYDSTGTLQSSLAYLAGVTSLTQVANHVNSIGNSLRSYRAVTNTGTLQSFSEIVFNSALGSGSINTGGYSPIIGINSAHTGSYWVGVPTLTPTSLVLLPTAANGGSFAPFTLTQTTQLTGISAVVLAPEPTSIIAIGMGMVALLKRKRA